MFEHLKNQIENTLGMYAESYVILPAKEIYEKSRLEEYKEELDQCHIYLIGWCPVASLKSLCFVGNKLIAVVQIQDEERVVEIDGPDGGYTKEEDGQILVFHSDGSPFSLDQDQFLHEIGGVPFEVVYVGQAYGRNGERKAIDRLLDHSKLQEIGLKGDPLKRTLTLLLVKVADHQLITLFSPTHQSEEASNKQIHNGITKLFGTTEPERISIYEAALIRYFYPNYNVIFKDSFPSTNLKILADCYDKDFAGIVAEIGFERQPFRLCSNKVPTKEHHIANFNLHKAADRDFFFFGKEWLRTST